MSRLALVLHSHMPYVEGFDTWPFGEEWLWEATANVYLPLLERLERAQAPITVGVTPVLADQLEAMRDGEPGERFLSFLREVRTAVHDEDERGLRDTGFGDLADEVRRAAGDYERADAAFEARGRDLIGAFRDLDVELWTSAATHALLPLVATEPGLALQLSSGTRSHERRFGHFGGGFWLPECAYVPGLERDLADHGVRVFCVDQPSESLQPVATEAGPVAVPIDWETISLVWNETSGYPAHPLYRDYHHRTTHDLRPWSNGGEPYDPEAARAQAHAHARGFVGRVAEKGGLVCCALDTELLGHWWYEGLDWLSAVLEEAPAQDVELVTVSEGVERVEPVSRELHTSSWGWGKDLSTWDSPQVAELAFSARRAELELLAATADGASRDSLARGARELLALQSSDWAFLVTRDLADDYPLRRAHAHEAGVRKALTDSRPDPALHNLAPDLDLASFCAP
jgi:1,4-alpha-glucan branching enzyme